MLGVLNLSNIDALIFDLGGVIVNLHPEETVRAFSEIFMMDARDLYTQGHQVHLFDEFERGAIGEIDFRTGVANLAHPNLEVSPEVFDRAWNAMIGPLPNENLEILNRLRAEKRIFLLSNTNTIHIKFFLGQYASRHAKTFGPFDELFEMAHYSHDLKMRKPEKRIFSELIQRHQLNPQRTIFVDDNQANVQAAVGEGLLGILHRANSPLSDLFAL